jgi:hypothetical protein
VQITNSPDITFLQVQVTFDISGATPIVSLLNQSAGPNLQNILYAFIVLSPTGTPIHEGVLTSPDITGSWTTYTLSDPWPMPAQSIEWSGAPYSFQVFAQDSIGNQYSNAPQVATICRPNGNTNLSKNTYGVGRMNVKLQCTQGNIFFEDCTNTSYQGLTGTYIGSNLTVVYPIDETNVIPTPFSISQFSNALVPITYSSTNYQYTYNSIYLYQLSPTVFIQLRYRSKDPLTGTYAVTFPVLCNIDLSPVVCNLVKLKESLKDGSCSDIAKTEQQILQITPALFLAFIGIEQPLTGVNVAKQIEEIQVISGWDCSCCYQATGIIPQTSAIFANTNFSVVNTCGDITGTVVVAGNNIQFMLADKSYVFALSNSIPTQAFSITPTINGCVKTYTLNVNLVTLSTDLLTTMASNPALVTLFNTIVQPKTPMLVIDGACVFSSNDEFDYTFTLANAPLDGTFIVFTGIQSSGNVVGQNYTFTYTTLDSIQGYLNSLGIGSFVVTYSSPGGIVVTTTANPNNLSNLTYTIASSSTIYVANMIKNTVAVTPVSQTYAIQQIVYYLCGFTDTDAKTSQPFNIPTITSGAAGALPLAAGSPLTQFLLDTISALNSVISYVLGLGSVNCTTLSAIFQPNANVLNTNNLLYGYKGSGVNGGCAGILPLELFNLMLTAGATNATTQAAFCAMVSNCGAGKPCAQFTYAYAVVTPYNTTCTSIVGIEATFS